MIRCLLHEWLSPLTGDLSDRGPRWLRRHRAACPRCEHAASGRRAVAARLRAEAARERRPVPPFLAARIRSAVKRAEAQARPGGVGRRRWMGWSLAAVAGLAVALAFGPWWRPRTVEIDLAEFTREQAGRLTQQVRNLPPEPVRALTRIDRPLQTELEAILADARTAALSLARVCVPEESIASRP